MKNIGIIIIVSKNRLTCSVQTLILIPNFIIKYFRLNAACYQTHMITIIIQGICFCGIHQFFSYAQFSKILINRESPNRGFIWNLNSTTDFFFVKCVMKFTTETANDFFLALVFIFGYPKVTIRIHPIYLNFSHVYFCLHPNRKRKYAFYKIVSWKLCIWQNAQS